MRRIFLYPKIDQVVGSPNSYMFDLQKALSKDHQIVNLKAPNRGVLSLFLFFLPTQIFILNWIEFLPEKKFGRIQALLFGIFLLLARLFRKKVIWVLHNKRSHHVAKNVWTEGLSRLMAQNSDTIITHSNAGLEFVKSKYPRYADKVKVIIHPMKEMIAIQPVGEKRFDFIIWGTIFPYKGIDKFLKFMRDSPAMSRYKLLLVGKCFDDRYARELEGLMTDNVVFYNEIFDLDAIAEFSSQAKFTLFTYKSDTIISSGSLMDAIRMGSVVIGPDYAAFKDLSGYSFLKTYESFEEIPVIHARYSPETEWEKQERLKFCKDNSWALYPDKLGKILEKL